MLSHNILPLLANVSELATTSAPPLLNQMSITSLAIFGFLYFALTTELIEKSLAAVLAAGAIIALGCLSVKDAMTCIDLNVLFLLIGMMTSVAILAETGFIEWLAIATAKKLKGNALHIMCALFSINMLISSVLPNVTVVILLIPVTILIAQILELPIAPLIILTAIASNIGGTATYIGDPPNTIMGSKMGIDFMPFIYNLTPITILVGISFIIVSALLLRKQLAVPNHIRNRILDSYPELAIRNFRKMVISLIIFAAMLLAFILATPLKNYLNIDLPCGIIAIVGMALMIILCKEHSDKMYRTVEWDAILFFAGLFVVIGALEHNGVISWLAYYLNTFCDGNLLLASMVVLFSATILSAFLDNIPYIIAMTPLIQIMISKHLNLPIADINFNNVSPECQGLIWALALGTCLGGNGTLIGASANIVAAKLGNTAGTPISFWKFTQWGFPLTLKMSAICAVYIWLRYFYVW